MKKSTTIRLERRSAPAIAPRLVLSAAALSGTALLARAINPEVPSAFDVKVRAALQPRLPEHTRTVLAPLFPLGQPGSYITFAHLTDIWLRRRGSSRGPAIIASAWLGWLTHRSLKLLYKRVRPRQPGIRRRNDSYPSGHTTGITAVALTSAVVLHREGILSARAAASIGVCAPLVMGAYRVVDDEHWATDVFGGWMLGGAIALACTALQPRRVTRRRPRRGETEATA